MTLSETLQEGLGDDVDIELLVSQLADLYEALDLPDAPFDPASIEGALQALLDADTGSVGEVATATLRVAAVALDGVPGAGEGATALQATMAALDAAGERLAGALDDLRESIEAAAGESPGDRVARAMTGISRAAGDDVTALLSGFLPAPTAGSVGVARDVLAAGGGVPALVEGVRALMDLAAGVAQGIALREAVTSLPDEDSITALRQEIENWDPSATIDRITSGDPVDEILADVAPALQRIADLEHALADLLAGTGSIVGSLDLGPVVATWRRVDQELASLDVLPVRDLATSLVAALEGPMRIRPSDVVPTADALATEVATLLDRLATAIGAVAVDRIAGGITAGVETATAPLREASVALAAVRTAVTDAHEAMEQVLDGIDLDPVAEAIGAVTEPATAALGEIRTALAAVSDVVGGAAADATETIVDLKAAVDEIAATLQLAFEGVAGVLEQLDIVGRLQQAKAALQPAADALEQVQIAQAADTAADAISRVAAVVDALPFELLPESATTELETLTAPIKSFDFDTEIRQRIATELEAIEGAIDTEVLDRIREAQSQAAAFVASIDPRPPLEAFEHDSFEPALERIRAFDPDALLAPMREAIAAVPDLSHLLDPVDAQFDALLTRFDELAPRALLEPMLQPVTDARAQAFETLRLDAIESKVGAAHAAASAAIDEISVVRWLDALAEVAAAALPGPAEGRGGVLGGIVVQLGDATDAPDPRTVAAAWDWLEGRAPLDDASLALAEARDALATLRDRVRDLDPRAILAQLEPGHREVAAAIADLPSGSLRRRLQALLPASPASLGDAYARAQADVAPAITGALTLASQLAALDLRGVRTAVASLGEALSPLAALREWVEAWVRRTGAATDPDDLAGSARSAILAVRAQLATGTGARLEAQVRTTLRAGLDAAAQAALDGVAAIGGVIDALDLEPVIAQLEEHHAARRTELGRFRPSTQLSDVVATLATLEQDLRTFDPLADVRPAVDAFRGAVTTVETELRPSILLAPALDAFRVTSAAVTSADIDDLFGPVLRALQSVTGQVDDGLDDIGVAFGRLQEALP